MGQTTFSGPLRSLSTVVPQTYTVASAPSASEAGAGSIIYVSNGAAGSPILAFSDGKNFKRSDTGATITAA